MKGQVATLTSQGKSHQYMTCNVLIDCILHKCICARIKRNFSTYYLDNKYEWALCMIQFGTMTLILWHLIMVTLKVFFAFKEWDVRFGLQYTLTQSGWRNKYVVYFAMQSNHQCSYICIHNECHSKIWPRIYSIIKINSLIKLRIKKNIILKCRGQCIWMTV